MTRLAPVLDVLTPALGYVMTIVWLVASLPIVPLDVGVDVAIYGLILLVLSDRAGDQA